MEVARKSEVSQSSSSSPTKDADVWRSGASTGARSLQRDLDERLKRNSNEVERGKSSTEESPARPFGNVRRPLKVATGLLIVAVFGWIPLLAIWQASSVEAVVNARLVTLRSPIDGKVTTKSNLPAPLSTIADGDTILRVVNSRGERSRLDELRRQLSRLDAERPSLSAKLATAKDAQEDFARQASQFREGRMLQLEARIAEIESSIEAAIAQREEATAAFERATSLAKTGTVSTVELARRTRDRSIAQQTETGARRRLDAARVELTAIQQGTYLGDSYNDRPSSVQREDEMRQRVADLTADLTHTDAEINWLNGEIASEQLHYVGRSEADIKAPISGRIWEMMTSPGEDVRAGQPLLKVLDCSGAVVTANVTEGVYNGLQLGEQTSFQPNDGGPAINGTVVNLTGASGAPANLAINPDVLNKEPYRVTVSLPQATGIAKDCNVGRTGRVIFEHHRAEP